MCFTTPEILSAQVFQADGITPVPAKGPLVPGTDFRSATPVRPPVELTMTMLTAAGTISPNQRLIITLPHPARRQTAKQPLSSRT